MRVLFGTTSHTDGTNSASRLSSFIRGMRAIRCFCPLVPFLVALGSSGQVSRRVFQSLHRVLLALGLLERPAPLGETVILIFCKSIGFSLADAARVRKHVALVEV